MSQLKGLSCAMTSSLSNKWKMNKKSTRMNLDHSVANLVSAKKKLSLPLSNKQSGSLTKISFAIVREELMETIGWMKPRDKGTSKEGWTKKPKKI